MEVDLESTQTVRCVDRHLGVFTRRYVCALWWLGLKIVVKVLAQVRLESWARQEALDNDREQLPAFDRLTPVVQRLEYQRTHAIPTRFSEVDWVRLGTYQLGLPLVCLHS